MQEAAHEVHCSAAVAAAEVPVLHSALRSKAPLSVEFCPCYLYCEHSSLGGKDETPWLSFLRPIALRQGRGPWPCSLCTAQTPSLICTHTSTATSALWQMSGRSAKHDELACRGQPVKTLCSRTVGAADIMMDLLRGRVRLLLKNTMPLLATTCLRATR